MATLLKVLNNLADIKSAGGVALRVRTQAPFVTFFSAHRRAWTACARGKPQAATVLAMSSNEWFAFIRCAASEYISRDRTAALGMAVATRTRSSRICWGVAEHLGDQKGAPEA